MRVSISGTRWCGWLPHKLLDPAHGPLIAVRLNILTRKTLGGLETDLDAAVMRPDGSRFDGLYAAGEVAGFGGGGVHGYNALEGTFLGGCIFSGRAAGRPSPGADRSGVRLGAPSWKRTRRHTNVDQRDNSADDPDPKDQAAIFLVATINEGAEQDRPRFPPRAGWSDEFGVLVHRRPRSQRSSGSAPTPGAGCSTRRARRRCGGSHAVGPGAQRTRHAG